MQVFIWSIWRSNNTNLRFVVVFVVLVGCYLFRYVFWGEWGSKMCLFERFLSPSLIIFSRLVDFRFCVLHRWGQELYCVFFFYFLIKIISIFCIYKCKKKATKRNEEEIYKAMQSRSKSWSCKKTSEKQKRNLHSIYHLLFLVFCLRHTKFDYLF